MFRNIFRLFRHQPICDTSLGSWFPRYRHGWFLWRGQGVSRGGIGYSSSWIGFLSTHLNRSIIFTSIVDFSWKNLLHVFFYWQYFNTLLNASLFLLLLEYLLTAIIIVFLCMARFVVLCFVPVHNHSLCVALCLWSACWTVVCCMLYVLRQSTRCAKKKTQASKGLCMHLLLCVNLGLCGRSAKDFVFAREACGVLGALVQVGGTHLPGRESLLEIPSTLFSLALGNYFHALSPLVLWGTPASWGSQLPPSLFLWPLVTIFMHWLIFRPVVTIFMHWVIFWDKHHKSFLSDVKLDQIISITNWKLSKCLAWGPFWQCSIPFLLCLLVSPFFLSSIEKAPQLN